MKCIFIIIIIILFILDNIFAQSKQSIQKDTSLYYLIGNKADFDFLKSAIKNPQDITPRQDSALVHWIETIKKPVIADTSKIKK